MYVNANFVKCKQNDSHRNIISGSQLQSNKYEIFFVLTITNIELQGHFEQAYTIQDVHQQKCAAVSDRLLAVRIYTSINCYIRLQQAGYILGETVTLFLTNLQQSGSTLTETLTLFLIDLNQETSRNYAQNISLKCILRYNYYFLVFDNLVRQKSFKSLQGRQTVRQDNISLIKQEK